MDLSPYVEDMREELVVAAEIGGDDTRALAERLTAPLESTTRLILFEALSTAASEITSELAPGSVGVRLRGREVDFLVAPPFEGEAPPPSEPPVADEGAAARINLRLPEPLKQRAEQAAGREGLSLNAWLVRAVGAALEPERDRSPSASRGERFSGWVS
jgi:HicB family